MKRWKSLPIPLLESMNQSDEPAAGGKYLADATNIEFGPGGAISGRRSLSHVAGFGLRALSTTGVPQTDGGLASFASRGYTARGLIRLRDSLGERPAMLSDGRIWSFEGDRWTDRLGFGSMRADRLAETVSGLSGSTGTRPTLGYDFGASPVANVQTLLVNNTGGASGSAELTQVGSTGAGNGCRMNSTGITANVLVKSGTNTLVIQLRNNGAATITEVVLDASAALTPTDTGDAPCISASFDAGVFFVVYMTTTPRQYKVLRVSTAGAILTTASAIILGLNGIWIDNSSVATNRVVVALSSNNAGFPGLNTQVFDATTLANLSLGSVTGGAGDGTGPIVVGAVANGVYWTAYKALASWGGGNILINRHSLTSGSLSSTLVTYFSGGPTTQSPAEVRWTIAHQPIIVGSRVYVTLNAGLNSGSNGLAGTWVTLDVTDVWLPATTTGSLLKPIMVARGASNVTAQYSQPYSAIAEADGTGFRFASVDFRDFSATGPSQGSAGMNKVALMGPREAVAQESTVISGSVPHMVQRGACHELGFPFLGGFPGLTVTTNGGGSMTTGSYSLQACWRWTDEAGQIHRSGTSLIASVNVPGAGTSAITAYVTNPQMTERESGVVIELYITDANPTSGAVKYLMQTVTPTVGQAWTIVNQSSTVVTTNETLYTDGGEFVNSSVSADGGITTMGRRLWVSDGQSVYGSKYLQPGKAPAFNDEGPLLVNVPGAAGRVVALHGMGDKLVILCERGVYFTQGDGPNNVGQGYDFLYPVKIADLGVAGPRSSVTIPGAVVFAVQWNNDTEAAGAWVLDSGLKLTWIGAPGQTDLHSGPTPFDVAYCHEREDVYFVNNASGGLTLSTFLVWNLRYKKWVHWTTSDLPTLVTSAGGVLWQMGTVPGVYDNNIPGRDPAGNYSMSITTSHLFANGEDGLGWARVREVRVLGRDTGTGHNLIITALPDQTGAVMTSAAIPIVVSSSDPGWPTLRYAPEWRLPQQKFSSLQISLTALPATARWVALELQIEPLGRAPAGTRV